MTRLEDDAYTNPPNNNYRQYFEPTVTQVPGSATSITVRVSRLGMPLEPATYSVTYQRVIGRNNTGGYSSTTISDSTNPKTITGLVAGAKYKITTKAIGPAGEQGNSMSVIFKLTDATKTPVMTSTTKGVSYLEIQGGTTADNKYNYAYRSFEAVTAPASTQVYLNNGTGDKHRDPAPSYPNGPYYYAFGTSFKFPALIEYQPQEAGIGFFLSDKGEDGYYVTFATSGTAASRGTNPVRIMKVQGKQIKVLKDSQTSNASTLDTLFSGSTHYVDIKVSVGGENNANKDDETVRISVYVNGQEITSSDVNSGAVPYNKILPITNRVSLLAASGKVAFDYVYATDIPIEKYDFDSAYNIYEGQFSDNYLQLQYGDINYLSENAEETATEKELKKSYDEFGTVVREIIKRDVTFGGGASIPNSFTTGGNKRVKMLAENKSHFGAQAFVLNNTSESVPLADEEVNAFAVYGSTIGFSGDIEYFTDPPSEYAVIEPITFESTWLQNEKDVELLADWIKSRIVNKAKIIDMKVFGNPIVSVGDIITVNYPYHKFEGTEKIIVTHVTHSFNEGLETSIKGRTI